MPPPADEPMFRLSEIFHSIQGESHWAGYPCTFVRLAGCNLACGYCDTGYARAGGTPTSLEEILRRVEEGGLPTVEVTGGEPLAQADAPKLLEALLHTGRRVLLETNGSLPLDPIPDGVHTIMDLKAPGSGMVHRNRWENVALLRPGDEVKIVCTDRGDYLWALESLTETPPPEGVRVNLSAVWGRLDPADLADWMVEDRLDVRLQIQLHRVLWPHTDRGV